MVTLACLAWFVGAAPSLGLDGLILGSKRDLARGELERARENVQQARAAAVAARVRLDAFLARHFEGQPFEPPPPVATQEPGVEIKLRPDPQLARLKTQLADLVAHRQELLGYLTEEHPEVVDVEGRIASLEERMASLGDLTGDGDAAGEIRGREGKAEQQWEGYLKRQKSLRRQDAAEYQGLYDEWQSAERRLDAALVAESAAAGRLAAIESALPHVAQAAPGGVSTAADDGPAAESQDAALGQPLSAAAESKRVAAAARPAAAASDSDGAQPLALAALLIALAVAALAAVRLARSTADPIFASADEVAAALAIPVVGIIPAAAARVQKARSVTRRRKVPLVLQLFVAGGVFALAAFVVQNTGGLWQHCSEALQAVGSATEAIGGN